MTTDQLLILLFGAIYFTFIFYTRRKGDFAEFSVAGRSMGSWLIFASLSAAFIGPGLTMGLSRDGFNNGKLSWYVAAIGGLGMVVTGWWVVPKLRAKFTDSFSIGDIIGGPKSHNHWIVQLAVGLISLYLVVAVAIIMSYAGGELVNHVFGLSKFWSILVITVIVTAYSSFGGVRATIQTDAFQFINFVILIPLLAILMIWSPTFNWEAYQTFSVQQTATAFNEQSTIALLGLVVYWVVSTSGLDPGFFNRYLAARSPQVAQRATVGAGLFIGAWILLMVFIGDAGAYLHPELTGNDQVLFAIGAAHFPSWLYGLFIIAMVGVIMSTQDTLINTSSIIFSEDLLGTMRPKISQQQKLIFAKGFTVFVGLLAILIAGFFGLRSTRHYFGCLLLHPYDDSCYPVLHFQKALLLASGCSIYVRWIHCVFYLGGRRYSVCT